MEISDQYVTPPAEESKPTTSDSESMISSIEDIHNWSFVTDPDMQNDGQPIESGSIECCRESFSSDSISVISEGEDLHLETFSSVQTNTSSIELIDHTEKYVENYHKAMASQEALPVRKSVIWTTPLVLGVVLATNAAILYGHSRIYQNVMNEFKTLQDIRVSELMNSTSKSLKCINDLETENGQLREEIERLKRIDIKSELEKHIHQTVLKLLSEHKSKMDDYRETVRNAKYHEIQFKTFLNNNSPSKEIKDEAAQPEFCYDKYATQDATFSEKCNFGHDDNDLNKIPQAKTRRGRKRRRILPKICYNKYATQDALFSEECNFGKHTKDKSETFKDSSEQLNDYSKQKVLPSFCYNQRVTQDALFAEECNFGESHARHAKPKLMKAKKATIKRSRQDRSPRGHNLPNERN
ncbi:uncharacterized protein LOC129727860 [Wyeomyia smithii]|uniref:uncharacterized protein LOC129727860 n=1 Tax=Wyeomyia smithii TaxID=174621 RepID=UPI002467BB0C|nr:uncharacterized protein LOC129727860 [Wyeomyia smithii]